MRPHLLLAFALGAATPAAASEVGLRTAVVAGGPSLEAGLVDEIPFSRVSLYGYAGGGLARGYDLAAFEAGAVTNTPGFYVGAGLRSEVVFDHGTVTRLGVAGEAGWSWRTRAGAFRAGLAPMLFVVGIGPALGLNLSWRLR